MAASSVTSTDSSSPGYKRCPDCAEEVPALARVCRYCGYRFDAVGEPASLLGDLIRRGLGRRTRGLNLPAMLSAWSFHLAEGEEVACFSIAEVDDRAGYLLVTSERLAFFARGSRGAHCKVLEHRLAELVSATTRGRGSRRTLELDGGSFRHRVDRPVTVRIDELLRCLAPARGADGQ